MNKLLTPQHQNTADKAALAVSEADKIVTYNPKRAREIYWLAYALLYKAGGIGNKRMAAHIVGEKIIPLATNRQIG